MNTYICITFNTQNCDLGDKSKFCRGEHMRELNYIISVLVSILDVCTELNLIPACTRRNLHQETVLRHANASDNVLFQS